MILSKKFNYLKVSEYGGVRGGAMSRWTFDKGQLNRQEWVSVGVGPAHLLVNMGQNMSYSANYADGSWDAVGMEGGRLVKTSYKEQFGKGCRNQTSHPHNTVRYIFMLNPKVDLG